MRFLSVTLVALIFASSLHGQSAFKDEILAFRLKHAVAKEVVAIMNEQFLETVTFSANTSTNTIYGRVPGSLMNDVEDFINDLEDHAAIHREEQRQKEQDLRESGDIAAPFELKIFELTSVDAVHLLGVLGELGFDEGKISLAAEPRTNSIVARGRQADLAVIESLLQRLDEPGDGKYTPFAEASRQLMDERMKYYQLQNRYGKEHPEVRAAERRIDLLQARDLEVVGGLLDVPPTKGEREVRREYEAAERNAATAAQKWRESRAKPDADPKKLDAIRSDVQRHVQKAFQARKALKHFEIDRASRQLHTIRQRLEQRDKIADKIVQRRIEDLLAGEDLTWLDQSNQQPGDGSLKSVAEAVTAPNKELKGDVQIEAISDLGIMVLRGQKNDVESVIDTFEKIEKARKTAEAPPSDPTSTPDAPESAPTDPLVK